MVSTMHTIEDLEQEYDQANSSEEEKINQLQLQCNMERSNEIVPDSAESEVGIQKPIQTHKIPHIGT